MNAGDSPPSEDTLKGERDRAFLAAEEAIRERDAMRVDELTFRTEVGEELIKLAQSIQRVVGMVNQLTTLIEQTNARIDQLEEQL